MAKIYEIRITDPVMIEGFTHLFPSKGHDLYFVSSSNLEILESAGIKHKVIKEFDTEPIEGHIIYPYRNFLYDTPDHGAIDEICAKLKSLEQKGKIPYAVFLGRNPDLQPDAFILDRVGRSRHYQWKIVATKKGEKSLAETFPKLVERMHDKDTKVVLSFGAGGLRFFAHASVMKFLAALRATSLIDEVWGCSGGAFSAYAFAMGVTPEDMEQKGYDLYHERHDLRSTTSKYSAAKMRIMEAIFPTSPNLLQEYAMFQLIMRSALLQLVEGKELEKPFYCTAYNVNTEHNDVLTPVEPLPERYKDFVIHADAIDSIIASSAIPVVFVPKSIRKGIYKEQYIDGSIAEDIPLLPVYRKWVIDREIGTEKRGKLLVIAINTFPKVAERPFFKRRFMKRLPFMDILHFGLELFDLILNIRFDEEFETLSHDQNVKVVKINLPLETPALLSCKVIPTIIQNAQTNLMGEFLKVEGLL